MFRYAGVFLLSIIIAAVSTPFVRRLAYRFNAIDIPKDERRIHNKPIPRMGGLAIYFAFVICSLIFSHFDKRVIGIIIGGTIIVIMGIMDDIKELKPLPKLAFQIAAALVLIGFGISVKSITVPFSQGEGSLYIGYLGIPITLFWVVGITNAINLIDGLDGLACGIGLISSLTLFGVALISGRDISVLLTVVLAGACMGFLPYNFNPASIFMGDTGAQFLGFALAAISIQGAIKSAAAVAVAVPILALGLPIYDTLFAMVRRKINKRPIMEADRGHLHHKLLDMGLKQRQVVYIMYVISGLLGVTSLLAMELPNKKSYTLLIVVCSIVLAFAVEIGLFNRKGKDSHGGDGVE
jgi:UDP-GlcNAc:undecaprenyl-phosphate GlcNAc-1-phosphate transferase